MKKAFIALAAIVLGTAAAHAETDFDGVYAGVDGGYGSTKVDNGGSDGAFSGGAFAGYGLTFDKIYLGGEAEAGINGAENDVGGVSVKQKWNYGVTGRVGYVVTPKVLVYGLAGFEQAQVKAKGGAAEVKGTNDGLKFGIGGETFVKKNISVRSEVNYIDWKGDSGLPDSTELKSTIGVAVHF